MFSSNYTEHFQNGWAVTLSSEKCTLCGIVLLLYSSGAAPLLADASEGCGIIIQVFGCIDLRVYTKTDHL